MMLLCLLLLVATTHAFAPLQGASSSRVTLFAEYQSKIDSCNSLLTKAATTKEEDSDLVFNSLSDLEKLMREKCKAEPDAAQKVLDNLTGDWRLIFTTGTKKSQDSLGGRINYFPIKAIQSFNAKTFEISNGIYLGDFCVIQFFGDFDFNLKSRKLEFDFDTISLFGLKIDLKKGQAAQLGASSGLGSDSNVANAKKNRKAFFNWIAADDSIATARGGGGGLALWKRIEEE